MHRSPSYWRTPSPGAQSDTTPAYLAAPRPQARGVRGLGLLIAVLLLAGVGGAIVVAHRRAQTNPVALIAAAPGVTTRRGSARITSTIAISLSGQAGPSITLAGISDFAGNATEMETLPGGITANIRLVGGVAYFESSLLTLPGGAHWIKVLPSDLGIPAAQSATAATSSPADGLQALGTVTGTPKVVGHETLGGVAVTHYAVTLDLARLLAEVSQAQSHLSPAFAKGFQALQGQVDLAHLPGAVWLDSAGRVRRFQITIAFKTARLSFGETQTTDFSDFGIQVKVSAPPANDTIPFSAAKKAFNSILGGTPA